MNGSSVPAKLPWPLSHCLRNSKASPEERECRVVQPLLYSCKTSRLTWQIPHQIPRSMCSWGKWPTCRAAGPDHCHAILFNNMASCAGKRPHPPVRRKAQSQSVELAAGGEMAKWLHPLTPALTSTQLCFLHPGRSNRRSPDQRFIEGISEWE